MEMDSSKLNGNVCRICLNQKVKFCWNDEILELCGISYKDCYFKYTKLEGYDSDCYPKKLCEMCANGLRNAHILFEKALESFNILQVVSKTKRLQNDYTDSDSCDSLLVVKCGIQAFDMLCAYDEGNSQSHNNTLIEIEDEKSISDVCDTNKIAENENSVNGSEEMLMSNGTENRHYANIKNDESSAEIPLEQKVSDFPDANIKNTSNKRKKFASVSDTSLVQPSGKKLSSTKQTSKRKVSESLLQQHEVCSTTEIPKSSATKKSDNNIGTMPYLEQSVSENCQAKPVKSVKSREKYLLMCQYCSLKVDGKLRLKAHEATHNENRQRNETCPKCGVKLYTKSALHGHMKVHDKNRQKNHRCEFCEKAFFHKGALNVHRRIHLGLMVKCQICSRDFFRQIDLDQHLLKHSVSPLKKNVGKKKYVVQCQYCNKCIATHRYKAHLAAHLDQPQMKCKICNRNFFSRNNCTNHLRRIHLKSSSEYEDCIQYYVEQKSRSSSLINKQKLNAQPTNKIKS